MSRWRNLIRIAAVPLCLVLNACLSNDLLKWGRDDVSVVGAWWGESEYLWSIVVDIQNVADVDDGQYMLPILDVRNLPSSHEGSDGTPETDDSQLGELKRIGPIPYTDYFVDYWDIGYPPLMALDAESLKSPDLGTLLRRDERRGTNWPPDFGVRLNRNDDHDYVLEVFAFDAKGCQQWVRIGKCAVGRGTQTRFIRKTAVVCLLPLAFTLDVLLMPVYLIRNQARWGCCCGPIPL